MIGVRRVAREPMTAMDRRGIAALAGCTFLPGEFNKRFTGDLEWARQFTGWISVKQRACLWRLVYRYRRQIKEAELISYAQLRMNEASEAEPSEK